MSLPKPTAMSLKAKKSIRLFFIILIGVVIATVCSKGSDYLFNIRDYKSIIKSGEINIVTSYGAPNYYVDHDSIAGFQHELIQYILANKGFKLNIAASSNINDQIKRLRKGEVDLIASNVIGSKEIKDLLALTFPIVTNKQVLVQRKDSTNITNQLDLKKKTLFITKNSPSKYRIQNLSNEIADTIYTQEIEKYGQEALPILVSHSDIDYAVCDEIIAKSASKDLDNIDISLAIGFTQFYSWGVNTKAPELLDSLNVWIIDFLKTEEYKDLYTKYYQ